MGGKERTSYKYGIIFKIIRPKHRVIIKLARANLVKNESRYPWAEDAREDSKQEFPDKSYIGLRRIRSRLLDINGRITV